MKYGKLGNNLSIGVVAPSFGCNGYPYLERGQNAINNLKKEGFNITTCPNCFTFDIANILNPSPKVKAKEMMHMFNDPSIDLIWSVAGGEITCETMKHISLNAIKKQNPKFYIGYSDNTWMTFLMPTICDVASIYSTNFAGMGSEKLHKSEKDLINIIKGENPIQHSYEYYEKENLTHLENNALCPMNDVVKTSWKSLKGQDICFKGRIIGGCLDVLANICGTKYDKVKEFKNRYKNDGVIFFFEACDFNVLSQLRTYTQLKNSGWFDDCKGIIIGRPLNKQSMMGITYKKMLQMAFKGLHIPIIYNADIGHTSPVISIIEGSLATVTYKNKKGTIKQELV